jgi:hypothetical protein
MDGEVTDKHSTAESASGPSFSSEDLHKGEDRGNDNGTSPEPVLVGEQSRRNDTERCKNVWRSTETLSVGGSEAHVLDDRG